MIGAKVNQFFFNQKAVIEAVGKARVKILSRAGFLVREDARASLTTRPPVKRPRWSRDRARRWQQIQSYFAAKKASASKPGQVPYVRRSKYPSLKSIIYSYDPTSQSVVVGPIVRMNRSSSKPVPELHEHGGRTMIAVRVKLYGRTKVKSRGGKMVVQKQTRIKSATYPARPIIGPAFQDVLPKIPGVMSNTIGPA